MKKIMNTHILGACGTFMAGVAQLAKALSHEVLGVDQNVYPPMSDLLLENGVELISGYDAYAELDFLNVIPSNSEAEKARARKFSKPDQVVIGNALSRGNPAVEKVLNQKLSYISGPQWLFENILSKTTVLAVSGTHGKTTTSSMLAWILDYAGYHPGFLIGGIPNNFNLSARLGAGKYFVIEADEYDSAFFDKRSKFIHYHPDILVINNIEFDHADIFNNLDEIKKQFHYLLRTVPGGGAVIYNGDDGNVRDVLDKGVWSEKESFSSANNLGDNAWSAELISADGSQFKILYKNELKAEINWQMHGKHNIANALAAVSAACKVGVDIKIAAEALNKFTGVKRRQELIAQIGSVNIYEDFAHHPTAIKTTLEGFRNKNQGKSKSRLVVLLELASNTMKSGYHDQELVAQLSKADKAYIYSREKNIEITSSASSIVKSLDDLEKLLNLIVSDISAYDNIVIMSNGAFGGIYKKLPALLKQVQLEKGL